MSESSPSPPSPSPSPIPDDERGASEVLGYVFVFTLVVASIGVVTVGGFSTLADVSTAERVQNSQQAFDILHDNMAELYTENAPSRATEISLGDSELFYGENVTVNVTVDSGGTSNSIVYEVRPVVKRLGNDRETIYEAGGTFRTTRQSGVVVRDPPFTFRSNSVHITIPALRADAVRSLSGSSVLVRGRVTDRTLEARETGGVDKVVVSVTSPRYEEWETFLSDQPNIDTCSVDDSANRVECTSDSSAPDTVYVMAHEIELSLIP
jgi:hypothetical protein